MDTVKVTDVPDIDAYLDREEKKNENAQQNGPIANKGPKAPPAIHVDIPDSMGNLNSGQEAWRQSVIKQFMSLNKQ